MPSLNYCVLRMLYININSSLESYDHSLTPFNNRYWACNTMHVLLLGMQTSYDFFY